jgi:hypothetical protein
LEDQLHRQSEQQSSKLPDESASRQKSDQLAPHLNAPVADQLVHKDDAADAPRRSLDGVKMEMRAGPPAPKGFITTGRKKIRDLSTRQSRDVRAGPYRKHVGWSPAGVGRAGLETSCERVNDGWPNLRPSTTGSPPFDPPTNIANGTIRWDGPMASFSRLQHEGL